MAATKIGIVYATKSKLLRRIIVPDSDEELLNPLHAGDGETIVTIPADAPTDHLSLSRLVGTHPDPNAARCVQIDRRGNVVKVIHADPAIDTVADHALISHPHATVGWTYNPVTKSLRKP